VGWDSRNGSPRPSCHRCFPNDGETPTRSSLSAVGNRFSSNNFKFFLLSIQSALHLSLAVLVRYRSPTVYLALGGVYHPHSGCTLKQPDSATAARYGSMSAVHAPLEVGSHGDFTLCVATFPGDLEPLRPHWTLGAS